MGKLAHFAVIMFLLEMVASAPVITLLSPHDGHVYADSNNIAVEVEVDRSSYNGTLQDLVLRCNDTILHSFPPKRAAIHEHSVVISELPNGRWNLSVGYEEPPFASAVVGFSVSIIIRNVHVHVARHGTLRPFSSAQPRTLSQGAKPAKIFDAFTFNDEIELLEVCLPSLRQSCTSSSSSRRTYQLRPKPLYLDTHVHRIAQYMHQIIRVT
eukprot:1079350-Rhodomonas_salina.5